MRAGSLVANTPVILTRVALAGAGPVRLAGFKMREDMAAAWLCRTTEIGSRR